ncbi:DUF6782 family putative metallopeptidase [Bifidobacterium imperatoris]|uniref:DUF6782 family putative metallopeptidase n=1 Tax=Bifidobacterium imperatoris TaxID=2020965 RepID=UPI00311A9A71
MDEAANNGIHVEERKLPNGLCGLYYEPTRLIVIDETLLDAQKRCTLVHELIHAQHHDQGCNPYDSKTEHRTRIQTALRLVNPIEYALAERLYGGNTYLIACELGLTVQVIQDYKNLLHESIE